MYAIRSYYVYYLNALSEFPKRGIHVCVIDMRGQGMSQGNYYDPAVKSISDLKKITAQIKKMTGVSGLALLGSGTGAGIIINAAFENDTIANALVLQNPPLSLSDVYSEQAEHEWGSVV